MEQKSLATICLNVKPHHLATMTKNAREAWAALEGIYIESSEVVWPALAGLPKGNETIVAILEAADKELELETFFRSFCMWSSVLLDRRSTMLVLFLLEVTTKATKRTSNRATEQVHQVKRTK